MQLLSACMLYYEYISNLMRVGGGECIKYVDGNMCERTVIKSPEPRLLALLEGSVSGNVLTWQRVGVGLG